MNTARRESCFRAKVFCSARHGTNFSKIKDLHSTRVLSLANGPAPDNITRPLPANTSFVCPVCTIRHCPPPVPLRTLCWSWLSGAPTASEFASDAFEFLTIVVESLRLCRSWQRCAKVTAELWTLGTTPLADTLAALRTAV